MPLGRQRRPQVQAGLLVAWVVVTAVDQIWPVPTMVMGMLALLTALVVGAALAVGWRRWL